jgi:hypothetical protein
MKAGTWDHFAPDGGSGGFLYGMSKRMNNHGRQISKYQSLYCEQVFEGKSPRRKSDHQTLLRWDDESRGEFLRIGHDEYYLTPTGLELLAVNLIFNTYLAQERKGVERLCQDLYQMGLMTDLYPFRDESDSSRSEA